MTHSTDDRQPTADAGLTEIVSKKRAEMVRERLYQELEAEFVEVDDQSHLHEGHSGAAAGGATLRWSWSQKRSKDWQPWHDTDSFMKQWGMP